MPSTPQAQSLAFGLLVPVIKQHGEGKGRLTGTNKAGEYALDTLRYLARKNKDTFSWKAVVHGIIEQGSYIHYMTSEEGRPTE